jgi:hypothetical protein
MVDERLVVRHRDAQLFVPVSSIGQPLLAHDTAMLANMPIKSV